MLCLGKPFPLVLLFIGIGFAHQRPKFASNSDLKCGITFYNDTESGHHRAKRVNHGDPAYEGQWPWMATLVFRDGYQPYDAPSIVLCSATIISEEYILSAGHCFINAEIFTETFQVAIGAVDVVTGEPIRVDIAAAFRHPYYAETATSLKNDILVLKLAKPLVLSDTVQPICLAGSFEGDDVTNPLDESALVAGWGLESHYGPTTDTLLYGHMYFVDIMTCALNHRFIEINKNNHICAAGKWQNTEQGDSGGPIFVKSALKDEIGRHRYVEVGICSFAWNPDVFARVSPYCDFIKKATNGSVNCVKLNHSNYEINKNNHICAAGKRQNTEQGDSGGPIFIKSELKDSETGRNRYVEVGICSFAYKPDVFARVSSNCEFIKETTNGSVNCVNL